jgi:hypothetical protein
VVKFGVFKGLGVAVAAGVVVLAAGAGFSAPSDQGLAAQASAFENFTRRVRAIDADFSGPREVADAVQTGAAYDPQQLEAGIVAYAAMAALQEPRFVDGLKAGRGPGDLAGRLAANPELALALPGGDAAAARASGALYAQGSALGDEGRKVKGAAYSIQRQAWSRTQAPDGAARLSRVKQVSAVGYQPSPEDPARLKAALAEISPRPGEASPAVARGVAVAALSVLGQEGMARSLMSDPRAGVCLKFAKLNLYQCLATSGPHYENIFCLGQHAMIDPGRCIVQATQPLGATRQASAG